VARRGKRRARFFAVAIALTAPFAATARAEAPARVRLELPACDDAFDKAELTRILRIELAADGVRDVEVGDTAGAPGPSASPSAESSLATIRVAATPCSTAAREVVIAIDDVATGKAVRRGVATADVAAASRPRALALAIAELLRASWVELAMPDAPAPSAEVPDAVLRAVKLRPARAEAAPTPAPAPETPMRTLVRIAFDARAFPSYQSVVVGPSIGASVPLGDLPLRARADAVAGFGKAYDALGTINLALGAGDLGLMLAGGTDAVRVELGPLLAMGSGWATGHPSGGGTGSSGNALIVTAQLAATFAVRISSGWWSSVGLEGGATLESLDAHAANRPASGFGGPLLGVSLGLAREL
jgi:hypothetical protein